jgi:hypothetical protein
VAFLRVDVPSVVPALCIVYWILLFLSRRWTAATSLETEAEGVPMGIMQKSVRLICQLAFTYVFSICNVAEPFVKVDKGFI